MGGPALRERREKLTRLVPLSSCVFLRSHPYLARVDVGANVDKIVDLWRVDLRSREAEGEKFKQSVCLSGSKGTNGDEMHDAAFYTPPHACLQ